MFDVTEDKHPVILVVDDQVSSIRLIGDAIRDLGDVHFATDGQSGLDKARQIRPDVVLLDIEMPGMNGLAVCRAIKADPFLTGTSIIFVTSHGELDTELRALDDGGVDFLTKPLHIPIARARIRTQLQLRTETRNLAIARRNLNDVIQYLPAFVAYWNSQLINVFCNDEVGKWFNVPASTMRGQHLRSIVSSELFSSMQPQLEEVQSGRNPSFDIQLMRQDGSIQYGQVSLVARKLEGEVIGFLMLVTDVTERRVAEDALSDEKERMRIALSSIGDAVIATDLDLRVEFLNPIAEIITGWQAEEALGQPIENIMPLVDHSGRHSMQNPLRLALKEERIVGMALNSSLKNRGGEMVAVEDSAAPIRDHNGHITGGIIVFHDVSEARAMALKMTHLANHDALTNLPNRMLLQDRTEQAIRKAERKGESVAMLIVDIDNFKTINDTLGHTVGDNLLIDIAERLVNISRTVDTVSRQGGDEFIILMPEIHHVDGVALFANRLLSLISEPFHINEHRFDLSVSIGIGLYPQDSLDMDTLYRHAESAMFHAKQEGRNQYNFFSQQIEQALQARHFIERHMRATLESGAFDVFYQAKVDANSGRVVGAEALIRWQSPNMGTISPAEFIPIAEETGLIIPIGRFVLERACRDARRWLDAGFRIPVSVNISAVQFRENILSQNVAEVLADSGLPVELLELEITESVLARDIKKSINTLNELRSIGVSIALDDFGTGYSSLAYLRQFPIDVLKIDRSFIRDMLLDATSSAIVEAVIRLGRSLGLQLVAEGVETRVEAASLMALNCPVMQGFLFSRPQPFAAFTAWLNDACNEIDETGLKLKELPS